jgi:5-formyltetrahydrofolate cyclo-ligase
MEGARGRSSLAWHHMGSTGNMHLQAKKDIRAEVLRRRKSLDAGSADGNSRVIEVMLAGSGLLRDVSAVLCYVSSKDNEVDTHGIIRGLLAGGKTVFVPVCEMNRRAMLWSRLLALEELERSHFGLLEPAAKYRRVEPCPAGAACLVPGLAFTRAGWRIGYGGGYFDRFLDTFSGVPIGLAHGLQIVEHIPTDEHDRPVDYLVTESGVTNCQELRNLGFTGA